MDKKSFITMCGKYAQKMQESSGILPSLMVAQACLETGYGTSTLGTKYNNWFGMKDSKSWTGQVVNLKTGEYYQGVANTVSATFRVYDSPESGLAGYYEFLQSSRYSNLKGIKGYRTACTTIALDGYATDPNYANKLISIIENNNLDIFDSSLEPELEEMTVIVQGARIRKEANLTSDVLHQLNLGNTVTVSLPQSNSLFYKVWDCTSKTEGYMYHTLLK